MKIEQNTWTQKTGWQPSAPGALGKSAQLVLVFGSTDLLKQSPLPKELDQCIPKRTFCRMLHGRRNLRNNSV